MPRAVLILDVHTTTAGNHWKNKTKETYKQNIHIKGWLSWHFSPASVWSSGAIVKYISAPMEGNVRNDHVSNSLFIIISYLTMDPKLHPEKDFKVVLWMGNMFQFLRKL